MVAAFKTRSLLIWSLPIFLLLQACAPSSSHRLADDPDSEPASIIKNEDEALDLPSQIEPTPQLPVSVEELILKSYDYVDPQNIVPENALKEALLYFDQNKNSFRNLNYISVLDYSQSSTKKRFYIINMKDGSVWNINVSHGKGSDSNHDGFAERFSNVSGSNATSLGFFKTAETYQGKHGYSLKLDGLSSTNSNARPRAIVIHGASYVQDKAVIQGRSWGCPAISMANYKKLIDLIKGGSMIYAVGK